MASAMGPIPKVTETLPPELKVETAIPEANTSWVDGANEQLKRTPDTPSRSLRQSDNALLSPTPPSRTPMDACPDGLSSSTTGNKLHGALKKSGGSGTRLSTLSPLSLSHEVTEIDNLHNGTKTPPAGRKGVQFSQDTEEHDPRENGQGTPPTTTEDRSEAHKPQSLYAKFTRALTTTPGFSHARSSSGWSLGARSTDDKELGGHLARSSTNQDAGLSATLEEGDSEADADAEESAAENVDQVAPRTRRGKGRRVDNIETAPSSPHSPMRSGFASAPLQAESERPQTLARRATDTDMAHDRSGVSEDEGRKRLSPAPTWTPRHPLRGLSYAGGQRKTSEGTPEGREGRRPLTLRNLTTISSARETDDGETPRTSRRKQLTERGTTLSAQKWRQLKQRMQMLSQGRKKPPTLDHAKSAELMAELGAGTPAALMLASMFQRDEHGNRRIPVLLEQLKVQVTDSEVDRFKDPEAPTPGDRHLIFRIELEYGNGINRMKWVIKRSLRDFANLHAKYKLHYSSEKLKGRGDSSKEMPKFPKSAFPYLKSYYEDEGDEEADEAGQENEVTSADPERPRAWARTSFGITRRKSSLGGNIDLPITPSARRDNPERQRERQRKMLETYLQRMIKFMLFRPDSNRLCKFLEVSALGMRLASEGSYHGKEGFLLIRSAKGLDFRKTLTPTNIKARHTPKWFLVRHSYVVCVDSPEAMYIYDVFLFDSDFRIQSSKQRSKDPQTRARGLAVAARESARHPQHHRLKLFNSERRLKLLARNERQLHQFEESITTLIETSPWVKQNRFDSFAPVRPNCFAQWLVDGRDHMWVVSRALNQAKDVIYIHDWWLSPELYMRRPPAISQKWRLDRLLKKKAEEGVKVFVIVYRNVESAVPIDSQYTKFSLLDLHPNIFVQRSPNQFRQNTFFWAHHEKICIVDHTLAFVGGIDLCFGRWDTPQHTLIDDKPTGFEPGEEPRDADHCQLWPGKDYSNPRVQDFYALNKPYEEMYDRQQVARMPWHDISMQIVGQPARDLTRHFVQRWNYILRQRKPTRPTPFLLPPPDFNNADLEALGLDGTCEVQILRSAGPWSLGTPDKTEHSIMNAYIKMIEESEHFVYMENQFFISSCETEGATVYNKIGDALVERITRASKNDESWRAVIVIPLIPGFQNTVEQEGGTSVRLIMQYQYRSICRGESSIFGRLRSAGIDPEDYIQFYSLRQWGRLGPRKALVTEQLYIHAKCMIVDDRVAIIGSANINERSMLGNRDSECAAIVRDTDMLSSTMNGEPYQVGRFPHSLRMRLMREHLGLDVDKIMEDAQAMENERCKQEAAEKAPANHPDSPVDGEDHFSATLSAGADPSTTLAEREAEIRRDLLERADELRSFNHDIDWEQDGNPNLQANRKLTQDHRVTGNEVHRQDVEGQGFDHMAAIDEAGFGIGRDTTLVKDAREVLITSLHPEGHTSLQDPRKHGQSARLPSYVIRKETPNPPLPPKPSLNRSHSEQLGLPMLSQLPALPLEDDTDIGGPPLNRPSSRGSTGSSHHPLTHELKRPLVDRDCMTDPTHDAFIFDTWHTIAENNTKIFRTVFRCMPDNFVRDWHEYHQYVAYEQRFNHLQGNDSTEEKPTHKRERSSSNPQSGPPGAGSHLPGTQLKTLSKVPSDLEKHGKLAKDYIMNALGGENADDSDKKEKSQLRAWAAEANQAQEERSGKPLQRRETSLDEKGAALATVPEDKGLHTRDFEAETVTRQSTPSEDTITNSNAASSPTISNPAANPLNEKSTSSPSLPNNNLVEYSNALNHNNSNVKESVGANGTAKRRRRATTRSRRDFSATDDILSVEEAEELLGLVQGHLVLWPYDWLEKVEAGSNWLFPFDQISPIEIYI